MIRRAIAADVFLAGACIVWGTNFVVVKAALTEFSPLAFNGLRFPLAAAFLLWLQWRREGLSVLRPHLGRLILLGLVGNLSYQLLFIYGLDSTRAGQASLFSATTPLWVLVLARLTGHDRFGTRVVTALLLAMGGVLLLLWESLFGLWSVERNWGGDLMLLGASAAWAVYTVFSQPLLGRLLPLALTAGAMVAGAVPLVIVALPEILALETTDISTSSWLALLYSSAMALVFGYLAWSWGVRALGSARTSLYVLLIPVVGMLTAWWWLGEQLTLLQAAGAAAVIAGIRLSRAGEVEGDQ